MRITAASLVAVCAIGAALGAPVPREADKQAKEIKILASVTASWRALKPKDPPTIVIRSAEELVIAHGLKDKAKDKETQERLTQALAKDLKVDKIDWKTQMLIVIDEGDRGNTWLSITSIKPMDKTLRVTYNLLTGGGRQIPVQCSVTALVERWQGDVQFLRTTSFRPNS
jgi:hypothetical protein